MYPSLRFLWLRFSPGERTRGTEIYVEVWSHKPWQVCLKNQWRCESGAEVPPSYYSEGEEDGNRDSSKCEKTETVLCTDFFFLQIFVIIHCFLVTSIWNEYIKLGGFLVCLCCHTGLELTKDYVCLLQWDTLHSIFVF